MRDGGDGTMSSSIENDVGAAPEFGELGGVVVSADEAIQIRSLLAHSGWEAATQAGRDAIEIALRGFGPVNRYRT